MNKEELHRALRHCHSALGDTLMLISDILSQQGNPDDVITRIEQDQAKYNAITQLIREHENSD